jgi:ribonucleotide monophosphatase NagD (HAD superfamily)
MTAPTIAVDFDGTIYPWANLFETGEPIPGAVEAIKAFADAGFQIVILTSRLSRRWLKVSGQSYRAQHAHIARMLRRDGIPFAFVTSEKVQADYYLDDRAICINDNWHKVAAAILGHGVREVIAP